MLSFLPSKNSNRLMLLMVLCAICLPQCDSDARHDRVAIGTSSTESELGFSLSDSEAMKNGYTSSMFWVAPETSDTRDFAWAPAEGETVINVRLTATDDLVFLVTPCREDAHSTFIGNAPPDCRRFLEGGVAVTVETLDGTINEQAPATLQVWSLSEWKLVMRVGEHEFRGNFNLLSRPIGKLEYVFVVRHSEHFVDTWFGADLNSSSVEAGGKTGTASGFVAGVQELPN